MLKSCIPSGFCDKSLLVIVSPHVHDQETAIGEPCSAFRQSDRFGPAIKALPLMQATIIIKHGLHFSP
jgi:hypothetical protein